MEGKNFLRGSLAANALPAKYCKKDTDYVVFSDSLVNELAIVTGSVSAGYVLTHTIYVAL